MSVSPNAARGEVITLARAIDNLLIASPHSPTMLVGLLALLHLVVEVLEQDPFDSNSCDEIAILKQTAQRVLEAGLRTRQSTLAGRQPPPVH